MNSFCAGIHVLVRKGNKHLLLKRSGQDKNDPVCWDLPGGGIDWGEQPLNAAIREAKEEANLDIKVNNIISVRGVEYPGSRWSMEMLAEGDWLDGEVKLSEEHTDHKWATHEEIINIEPKGEHLIVLSQLLQNETEI